MFSLPSRFFLLRFPCFSSEAKSGSGHPKQLQRTEAAPLSHGTALKSTPRDTEIQEGQKHKEVPDVYKGEGGEKRDAVWSLFHKQFLVN